jgi:hypothetical protein
MTSLPTASELAAMNLTAQHPLTRIWVDEATRLAHLAEEHAFDLRLATDLELAGKRAEFLNVGQPPEAFLNLWFTVSPDLDAMLSIRFERLDPQKPFVDVSVTSRPVLAADLPALSQAVLAAYGAFRPQRLRFWSAAEAGAFPGTRPDMRVLAAPLADLRGGEVPDGLTLAPTRDTLRHADAVTAYAAVDSAHPDYPRQARVIEQDHLTRVIEAGTMFDVIWQGKWSGYAGVLAKSKHGLPAYSIQELLLATHARGHGLGPHLTPLLARALPDDARVLLGTIHGENRGALQAALAAGRHDLGGWSWLPLS